ncbi:hypothetical protein [Kaarinaea lacus]
MKIHVNGACAIMLASIVSGCISGDDYAVVDSPGVATSSISAEMHVSYTGSQAVTIEVMLREGQIDSNTDINLTAGDVLKASTIGDPSQLDFGDDLFDNLIEISNQVKTLEQGTRRVYNDIIAGIWYYATTDAKYRDKEFTLSLLRGGQNDAPNSVVRLPPDFNLSVDEWVNGSEVSRSGPITLRWSPVIPGYSMEISGFVNCDSGTTAEWPGQSVNSADGSLEIPALTFDYTGDCIITFRVESWTLGSPDPALDPSSFIKGHQYRTMLIATVE